MDYQLLSDVAEYGLYALGAVAVGALAGVLHNWIDDVLDDVRGKIN